MAQDVFCVDGCSASAWEGSVLRSYWVKQSIGVYILLTDGGVEFNFALADCMPAASVYLWQRDIDASSYRIANSSVSLCGLSIFASHIFGTLFVTYIHVKDYYAFLENWRFNRCVMLLFTAWLSLKFTPSETNAATSVFFWLALAWYIFYPSIYFVKETDGASIQWLTFWYPQWLPAWGEAMRQEFNPDLPRGWQEPDHLHSHPCLLGLHSREAGVRRQSL